MSTSSNVVRALVTGTVATMLATATLGLAYPAIVWLAARPVADSADGHLIREEGCILGSELLADGRAAADPEKWFRPRAEGATNLSPSDTALAANVEARRAEIADREDIPAGEVPADAVTGSGSGVDAGISVDYAMIQIPRVARANGLTETETRDIVEAATVSRSLGVLGEPWVNVTLANGALPGGSDCR